MGNREREQAGLTEELLKSRISTELGAAGRELLDYVPDLSPNYHHYKDTFNLAFNNCFTWQELLFPIMIGYHHELQD